MFGFGGGNYGGPGEGVGGGPGGPGGSGDKGLGSGSPSKGGGMSPSERNAQGKEGTNSGPGNPGHSPSTSGGSPAGGKEYSGYGSHEGQTSGPGNPSASGSAPGKGDRVGGGYSVGNVDPARFGGSTPTGFSPDIDPTRFGGALSTTTGDRVTRGFGAAIPDRTFRDTEDASMAALDRMRSTDMASSARAAENASIGVYSAAAANSAANATRADTASTVRAAENQSVTDLENRRAALNNTIAGTESPDYNTIYGGTKFTSYDDHPRQAVTITSGPNKGKKSTAAGKYQMLSSTWDRVSTKLGLTDFSPKNQDLAAQELAREAYAAKAAKNQTSYPSLDAALAAGDTKGISKALSGMWTSLPGGIEQATTTDKFAKQYDQHLAALDTKTVTDRPVTDRFASTYLDKDQKQAQVDYFGSVPDKNYPGNNEVATRNPDVYGNTQTASVAPDDAAPKQASITQPQVDPSLKNFPDRPRTGFEKVAAAGLDIGAGMIPGIGLGVGLINGGLSLTGNRTIGTRIVDAIATGKGGKGAPIKGDPQREYQVADTTIPVTTHTTVPTVDKFVDSYLSPPDATKYPTPYQKYDLGRDSYAGA